MVKNLDAASRVYELGGTYEFLEPTGGCDAMIVANLRATRLPIHAGQNTSGEPPPDPGHPFLPFRDLDDVRHTGDLEGTPVLFLGG